MKMEKLKFFLMALCFFVAGCSDDEEPVILTPETTTVTLDGLGDSQTVKVTCNGQWTAVPSLDWCKVAVKDAEVVISAEENKTGAELKAEVVLTCGDMKAVIKVSQGIPADPVNGVFAQTTKQWYFDFDGFQGTYKTAYETSVAGLIAMGWASAGKGYALQSMSLTQGRITFLIYDEDYKSMGAPEDMYAYKGSLLVTIEPVNGTRDQVIFKDIDVDPEADEDDQGDYWYGEQWGSTDFRAFVNTLLAQPYSITVDETANPQVLTFSGVTDPGSAFKLKLQE